jgi:hypothetical protein
MVIIVPTDGQAYQVRVETAEKLVASGLIVFTEETVLSSGKMVKVYRQKV